MDSYRKIGIGEDLKNGLFYVVGSKFRDQVVSNIILKDGWFVVYLRKGDEVQEWKSFKESIVTVKEHQIIE